MRIFAYALVVRTYQCHGPLPEDPGDVAGMGREEWLAPFALLYNDAHKSIAATTAACSDFAQMERSAVDR